MTLASLDTLLLYLGLAPLFLCFVGLPVLLLIQEVNRRRLERRRDRRRRGRGGLVALDGRRGKPHD